MIRRASATALLIVGLLAQAQQSSEPRFTSAVSLVRVDVQVADPTGRVITGLKAEDFVVTDDGQPQPIRNFIAETGPVDLMLVLDVSGSMSYQLSALGTGARFALDRLRDGDRIGILTFAARAHLVQELTADFDAAESILRNGLKTGGGTDIYGGIQAAAKYFIGLRDRTSAEIPPRRAILAITDNVAFSLIKSKEKQTVREMWEADAVLNALVVANPQADAVMRQNSRNRPPGMLSAQDVEEIAIQTGGEAVDVREAAQALPQMLDRIRTRYLLYYSAPASKPGAFHRIRVDLSDAARKRHPVAMLRARLGYYSAAATK